MTEPLYSVF